MKFSTTLLPISKFVFNEKFVEHRVPRSQVIRACTDVKKMYNEKGHLIILQELSDNIFSCNSKYQLRSFLRASNIVYGMENGQIWANCVAGDFTVSLKGPELIFFPNSMEKQMSYLGHFSISFEKITFYTEILT